MPDVVQDQAQRDREERSQPWWNQGRGFEYGTAGSPEALPTGHAGVKVGEFGERVMCSTCAVICLRDPDDGMWVDTGTLTGTDRSPMHLYPAINIDVDGVAFARVWAAQDVPAIRRVVGHHEATLNALGIAPEEAEKRPDYDSGERGNSDQRLCAFPMPETGNGVCIKARYQCQDTQHVEWRATTGSQAAFRSARGIKAVPRPEMPSRQDRSAEYATRNANRRRHRRAARQRQG